MDYLPANAVQWLEGSIDPQAQSLLESYSQLYLAALTAISFAISLISKSVLLPLEIFAAGIIFMLLAIVPPWPHLNRHPVKYLTSRQRKM